MEFEFYRNFITVAESGSITAAARKLSLAQPALSAQINTLEEHYGVKLLKKGRGLRRVELTEAGSDFLQKARRICSVEESILTSMSEYSSGTSGLLRFSISPAAMDFFLNKYLIPFASCYPDINMEIQEIGSEQQVKNILDGSSDFAFANAPLPPGLACSSYTGSREYLYAVFLRDKFGRLAEGQGQLAAAQLHGIPLSCNFGCRSLLLSACSEAGFEPRLSFVATNRQSALAYAAAGLGTAVVSAGSLGDLPQNMCCRRLAGNLYFERTLLWHDYALMSPCARMFLEYCVEKHGESKA